MAAFGQRLGHGLLAELGLFPRRERTDLHQVVPQANAIAVRLPGRQLSSRFVLSETMFGAVGCLPNVDGSERARFLRARPGELDDVDVVGRRAASGHCEEASPAEAGPYSYFRTGQRLSIALVVSAVMFTTAQW